jgi:surface protein
MKLKLNLILLLAAFDAVTARCRRWLGKCAQNSDCCNNRRCMKWGRCSLVHQAPSNKVYKCFENRTELVNGVKSYREGNKTEKILVKEIYGNPIGTWCVGSVTDFLSVFDQDSNAAGFNDDISRWNTSSATKMKYMFYKQTSFNQDLSRWDVSKVTDMQYIFYKASSFNKDLSSWNVSVVTSFFRAFYSASTFNKNLCNWRDKISDSANLGDIFYNTSCPNASNPWFDGNTVKNVCYNCV